MSGSWCARQHLSFAQLVFFTAACFLSASAAANQSAVAVQTVPILLDGKPVADLPAGTPVEIVGQKPESAESLIRLHREGQQPILGLVPSAALVATSEKLGGPQAAEVTPAATPAPEKKGLDPTTEHMAAEFARYFKANRNEAKDRIGTRYNVTGVVESLRLGAKMGEDITAEIYIKTANDLPKVKLVMKASDFLEGVSHRDQELRINGKTLEARSRANSTYYYYYSYNPGYGWYRTSAPRTKWVPIISVGNPMKAAGVLSKFHIDLELEDVELARR